MVTIELVEMKSIGAHDMNELSIRFNEWAEENQILADQVVDSNFYTDGAKFWYTVVYRKAIKVMPKVIPNKVPKV